MKTQRVLFLGFIMLFSIVQFSAAQMNYNWVGGTDDNWNEANNWSPAAVPGMNDTAIISLEGDYSVILDVDATVAKIVLGGASGTQTFTLSGRTLTMNGDIEVGANGVLSVANSTISGTGSILNSGSLESTQGIFNTGLENYGLSTFTGTNELTDTIITHPNSTFNIVSSGPIDFRSDKGFENNGLLQCLTYNYWAGGTMEVTNGSLVNNAGGVINILVPGTISGSSSPFNFVVQLENHGELFVDHWTVLQKSDAVHVNNGELILQDNTLTITQVGTTTAFSNTGTLSVDETSTLNIQGGTVNLISGSLDVQGLLAISSSTVNIIPDYTNVIPLSITGSILNCSSSFTNQENLDLINTTVNGDNSFTNLDTMAARGAVFNMDFVNEGLAAFSGITELNDTLITRANSTLRIASYSNIRMQFTSASGFTNHGLIQSQTYNYWAGGHITITDGALVNNEQGRIVIWSTSNISSSASALRLILTLDNRGELLIDHITNLDKLSAIHTNNGSISVTDRVFSIIQTGTDPAFINTGDFLINEQSTFAINGGTFDYISGNFDPQGNWSVINATVNLTPEYTNTSSITMNTSILNCTAAFTNQSDLELISTTINGEHLFTNQDTMTANGIVLNMDFNNYGMASLTGPMTITDTLITNPNSTLNILSSSYMDFTSEKGIENNGLLQCITRNYWGGGTMEIVNGSLTNNEDGIFNILVQGTLSSASSPITLAFHLVNRGELLVDHESILSKGSVMHENTGVFTLMDHTLTINQVGTSFINQPTGSIYGNGTISLSDVDFTNSGAINPGLSPGLLTISGDVSQDPGSITNIELGGLTLGTEYDKLNVSGTYDIDGQLNIELIDGFNPTAGDVFDIVEFLSATGDFVDRNLPYPGTGVIFTVDQTPTNINLTAVAHANNPPLVEVPIPDMELMEDFDLTQVADLDTIFNDPDLPLGDNLDYSFDLLDNILEASITDNVLSLTSIPDINGASSLIITASDAGQAVARDTFVIQVSAVNDAPEAFSLVSPADGSTILGFDDLVFTWESAYDVDGDALEYTLNLSTASWDSVITQITDTAFIFSNVSNLEEDAIHQWSVSASDGQLASTCLKDFSFTSPVSTNIHTSFAPPSLRLEQNYPNPFSSFTNIDFSLPGTENVTIKIYSIHGGLIHSAFEGELPPGNHSYRLELQGVPNGTYFYKLEVGSSVLIKKMTKIE